MRKTKKIDFYFWSNESDPLEPVHVHIAEGRATDNGTKVWTTSSGKALLCNNAARIPQNILRSRNIQIIMEDKKFREAEEIRFNVDAARVSRRNVPRAAGCDVQYGTAAGLQNKNSQAADIILKTGKRCYFAVSVYFSSQYLHL